MCFGFEHQSHVGVALLVKLILVSHGPLAAGVAAAAEMILGPLENVVTVGLEPSEGPDQLHAKIAAAVGEAGSDGAVILCDLFGGTPFNVSARFCREQGVPVITGLNLPMLLNALTERERTPAQLAGALQNAGRDGVISLAQALDDQALLEEGGERECRSS